MEYTEEQKKVFNFVQYDSNHGIIDAGSEVDKSLFESLNWQQ